jgi:hypothetical protein
MFISVDLPEPDDGDELAGPDREVDPAQRLDRDVTQSEGAGDVLDPDDRLGKWGVFARH